jgi:type IV pilus assembly protein PilO
MALKFDMKNLPSYGKIIISLLPSLIVSLFVIILFVMPKQKEIKTLDTKIDDQNNQIASSQAKAARLDILKRENEQLVARLNELKEQLPEEKEISGLLKQVSDLSIASGLEMKSWKPGAKKRDPSGIVDETPMSVNVTGVYHDFGKFLSSLTRLNRIVNVTNIQVGSPQIIKGIAVLPISFTASTFSSVPEAEIGKKPAEKK